MSTTIRPMPNPAVNRGDRSAVSGDGIGLGWAERFGASPPVVRC